MNPVLITPSYLAPVAWWQHALQAPNLVLDAHTHYQKQTYRNRCKILSANGILDLTIPIVHPVHHKNLQEIQISYEENWQKQHWQAICSAYGKSAFFMYYRDSLEVFFQSTQPGTLWEWNLQLMEWTLQKLKLTLHWKPSAEFLENPANTIDLRDFFKAKGAPRETELLSIKKYPQVFSDKYSFVPNLSILDLLLNEGPASKQYLLQ